LLPFAKDTHNEFFSNLLEKIFFTLIIMNRLYINEKTGDARNLLYLDPCDPSPENLLPEAQGMGQGYLGHNG
jgi:hypothetical protein